MKKILFAIIMMATFCPNILAQQKLSESELVSTAKLIETDWRFGFSHVLWLEDKNRLDYFLSTAHDRCVDDLTEVVELSGTWHEEIQRILQVERQVYPKPGTKKSEQSLARYFSDTQKAKERFAKAHEADSMYERLVQQTTPIIQAKQAQVFSAPQGELTYFYFNQGGGMVYRPPLRSILQKQKDGTYIVELDTEDFDRLDTIPVTQAQVDTIRQMLIEGEVYKMPRLHDEPFMLLDAPHSSVSVRFTDAEFSCNNYPPSNWGGKNIWAVYRYLKALQPAGRKPDNREPL